MSALFILTVKTGTLVVISPVFNCCKGIFVTGYYSHINVFGPYMNHNDHLINDSNLPMACRGGNQNVQVAFAVVLPIETMRWGPKKETRATEDKSFFPLAFSM